ncbi:hypothetical protein N7537_005467 [Penicillium hordei]|uniref:2-dehydropantoate 2-reductase n=1 Tax=Penicillium hordei TaxID=40994 RepID=A0AAD6E5U9_9EURO|nr:uncharacterized protein N7537_005467 [Penicillium hordei]KAJ5602511.1 hypothetical protein N7537_005467 [Penicillium hordei]
MCFDYVVITSKNTPDYPLTIADLVDPATALVQNGLNIETPYLQRYTDSICLSSVSLIGPHKTAPAVIENEGHNWLIIGLISLASCTGGGKTDCTFIPDVPFHRWQKLAYNVCLNPICAITGLDTGRIRLAEDTVSTVLRPAMQEIVAAAKAVGVILHSGIEDRMINIDPLTMYLRPSMLEDVQKGNLVEFETLVGEPLREGLSCGVSMPTLTVLYRPLKAMQWRLKKQRGIIDVPAKGEYLNDGLK